jgi:hypothetical protein
MMKRPEHPMRELAMRLLSQASDPGEAGPAAAHVLERLDTVLWRLAGQVGSRSLMQRALSLARSEAPSLMSLHIPAVGPFTSAGWQLSHAGSFDARNDQVVLVAHVLELLQTFIGARLTLQLVKEAWPDLDPNSEVVPLDPTT